MSGTSTGSSTGADRSQPLLSLRGIDKTFGAVRALSGVDLDIYAGEVVALLGDNGAGKSTLVKVLAGVHPADAGTITFKGQPAHIHTPYDAQLLGIATIFQDLALCDNLDVVGNLFLGREKGGFFIGEEQMEKEAWRLLGQLSARIPSVRIPIASLSGGQRQTVAIARALIGEPAIVMLDEPTAALGVAQTQEVLNMIDRLRSQGHGIVLITHNMADVKTIADRAVVLRLGRNNGNFKVAEISHETIIGAITGAVTIDSSASDDQPVQASAEGAAQ